MTAHSIYLKISITDDFWGMGVTFPSRSAAASFRESCHQCSTVMLFVTSPTKS